MRSCVAMELIDDPFESSSSRDEKVEPEDLLEDCWFFGNLLDRKTSMPRCYSDPYPSSSNYSDQEMLVRKTYHHDQNSSSIKKLSRGDHEFVRPDDLIRTPSIPPCMGREVVTQEKQSHSRLKKSISAPSSPHNLVRTPSLPPCIGREEVEDQESDFAMGKLIRQASLNPADMLPPKHTSKGMAQSSSAPSYRPRRKQERESMNMEGCKEMRRRYVMNQMKMTKSLNDLEVEEVQGFRELGFRFEKEDINPSVVNILPGLQEKKRDVDDHDHLDEDNKVIRRPYLSEAWLVRSSAAPHIPNWDDKRSAQDMKTQIKFWARAVASNVRQEC